MDKRFQKHIAAFLALLTAAQPALAARAEASFWLARRESSRARLARVESALPAEASPGAAPMDLPSRVSACLAPHGAVRDLGGPENAPVLVHFQDMHGHLEAQRRLGEALSALALGGLADALVLEGAWGPVDAGRFRAYPDRPLVRRTAEWLLKENKVSGPVFAAMTGEGAWPATRGADDPALYAANVAAARAAHALRGEARARADVALKDLAARRESLFNRELKAVDAGIRAYRRGDISLSDHARSLASRVAARPGSALDRFLSAEAAERGLDLARVEGERRALLQDLSGTLDPAALRSLAEAAVRLKSGGEGSASFHARLSAAAGDRLSRYSALASYIGYVRSAEGVDAEALRKDLAAVERAARKRLTQTAEERALLEASDKADLEARLADLVLSPEDWAAYGNGNAAPSPFIDFYRAAQARDAALADNALAALKASGGRAGVLVAGGFHGPGVAERLRAAGAHVLVFTPRVSDMTGGADAIALLAREKSLTERLMEGERMATAPPPAEAGFAEAPPLAAALSVVDSGHADVPSVQRILDALQGRAEVEGAELHDLEARVRFKRFNGTVDLTVETNREGEVLVVRHKVPVNDFNEVFVHPFLDWLVGTHDRLLSLKDEISALPSLEPDEHVNALFGELVRVAGSLPPGILSDLVLGDSDIRSVRGVLQNLYGTRIFLEERHWAVNTLASGVEVETAIAGYPTYDKYSRLIGAEMKALTEVLGRAPRSVLMVGSGPAPLTLMITAREYPGLRVDGLERDQEAFDLSTRLVAASPWAERTRVILGDAETFDRYADYDAILLGAMVGEEGSGKENAARRVAEGMSRDALVMVRTVHGLKALLYPEVQPRRLKGLELITEVRPGNPVVNSTLLFSKSGSERRLPSAPAVAGEPALVPAPLPAAPMPTLREGADDLTASQKVMDALLGRPDVRGADLHDLEAHVRLNQFNGTVSLDLETNRDSGDAGQHRLPIKDFADMFVQPFLSWLLGIHDRLLALRREIDALKSLEPGPTVDRLFGELVRLCASVPPGLLSDWILADDDIHSVRGVLQNLYGRRIFLQERAWAVRTLAEGRDVAVALADYPTHQSYSRLIASEMKALEKTLGRAPKNLLMIGSGPVPLTVMLAARDHPEMRVDGLERDREAFALSSRLVAASPWADRTRIILDDAEHFDRYKDYDAVLLGAMVGEEGAGKESAVRTVVSSTREDAVLLIRSVDGLRALLYPRVQPEKMPGLSLVGEVISENTHTTSTRVAQRLDVEGPTVNRVFFLRSRTSAGVLMMVPLPLLWAAWMGADDHSLALAALSSAAVVAAAGFFRWERLRDRAGKAVVRVFGNVAALKEFRRANPALRMFLLNDFAFNLGFYILMPHVALHLESTGLSLWAIGLVLGARNFSQHGLYIVGGQLADRLGEKRALVVGTLLRAAGFGLFGLAGDLSGFLAASALSGLGATLVIPSAKAGIARESGERRAEASALAEVLTRLGTLAGPVIGVVLLSFGFETVAAAAGGVFLVWAAVLAWRMPRPPAGTSSGMSAWRDAVSNRPFLRLLAGTAVFAVLYNQLFITLPLAWKAAMGSATGAGLLFTVSAFTVVLGQMKVTEILKTRLSPAMSMALGYGVMGAAFLPLAAGALLPGGAPAGLAVVAVTVLLSLGSMAVTPFAMKIIPDLSGNKNMGVYHGFYFMALGLGGFAGQFLGGQAMGLAKSLGTPWLTWVILAGIGFAGAAVFSRWARHDLRGPPRAGPRGGSIAAAGLALLLTALPAPLKAQTSAAAPLGPLRELERRSSPAAVLSSGKASWEQVRALVEDGGAVTLERALTDAVRRRRAALADRRDAEGDALGWSLTSDLLALGPQVAFILNRRSDKGQGQFLEFTSLWSLEAFSRPFLYGPRRSAVDAKYRAEESAAVAAALAGYASLAVAERRAARWASAIHFLPASPVIDEGLKRAETARAAAAAALGEITGNPGLRRTRLDPAGSLEDLLSRLAAAAPAASAPGDAERADLALQESILSSMKLRGIPDIRTETDAVLDFKKGVSGIYGSAAVGVDLNLPGRSAALRVQGALWEKTWAVFQKAVADAASAREDARDDLNTGRYLAASEDLALWEAVIRERAATDASPAEMASAVRRWARAEEGRTEAEMMAARGQAALSLLSRLPGSLGAPSARPAVGREAAAEAAARVSAAKVDAVSLLEGFSIRLGAYGPMPGTEGTWGPAGKLDVKLRNPAGARRAAKAAAERDVLALAFARKKALTEAARMSLAAVHARAALQAAEMRLSGLDAQDPAAPALRESLRRERDARAAELRAAERALARALGLSTPSLTLEEDPAAFFGKLRSFYRENGLMGFRRADAAALAVSSRAAARAAAQAADAGAFRVGFSLGFWGTHFPWENTPSDTSVRFLVHLPVSDDGGAAARASFAEARKAEDAVRKAAGDADGARRAAQADLSSAEKERADLRDALSALALRQEDPAVSEQELLGLQELASHLRETAFDGARRAAEAQFVLWETEGAAPADRAAKAPALSDPPAPWHSALPSMQAAGGVRWTRKATALYTWIYVGVDPARWARAAEEAARERMRDAAKKEPAAPSAPKPGIPGGRLFDLAAPLAFLQFVAGGDVSIALKAAALLLLPGVVLLVVRRFFRPPPPPPPSPAASSSEPPAGLSEALDGWAARRRRIGSHA